VTNAVLAVMKLTAGTLLVSPALVADHQSRPNSP